MPPEETLLQFIQSLGTPLEALSAFSVTILAAFAAGHIFIRKIPFRHPLSKLVLKIILGLDLFCISAIILGTLFSRPEPFFYLAVPTLALWTVFYAAKNRSGTLRLLYPLFIALLLALPFIATALSYPENWDELTYQICLPLRWKLRGNFPAYFEDLPYSAFPNSSGMLQWALISTGGILTGRLLAWTCWVLSGTALFISVRSGRRKGICLLMTAAFMLSDAVLMTALAAYAEQFIVLHVAGAVLIATERKRDLNKKLAMLGLMTGLCASVKLTALIIPLLAGLYVIVHALRRQRYSGIFCFFVPAVFAMLIFYIRPFLFTGNPFHPYFSEYFTGGEHQLAVSGFYHAAGSVKYGLEGAGGFFLGPFILSMPAYGRFFDGSFGYFLAFTVVLGIFAAARELSLRRFGLDSICIVSAALIYTFWFFTSQQARFLLPAVFLVFIPATRAVPSLLQKGARHTVYIVLLVMICISLPRRIIKHNALCWRAMAEGGPAFLDYLYTATGPGYLKSVEIIRTKTAPDSRVMLLFEHRGLYMPRDYVIGTPVFQNKCFARLDKLGSTEYVIDELRECGTDFLLVGLSAEDPDRIPGLLDCSLPLARSINRLQQKKALKLLWSDDGYALYRLQVHIQ